MTKDGETHKAEHYNTQRRGNKKKELLAGIKHHNAQTGIAEALEERLGTFTLEQFAKLDPEQQKAYNYFGLLPHEYEVLASTGFDNTKKIAVLYKHSDRNPATDILTIIRGFIGYNGEKQDIRKVPAFHDTNGYSAQKALHAYFASRLGFRNIPGSGLMAKLFDFGKEEAETLDSAFSSIRQSCFETPKGVRRTGTRFSKENIEDVCVSQGNASPIYADFRDENSLAPGLSGYESEQLAQDLNVALEDMPHYTR